jgi:hypothetical protein
MSRILLSLACVLVSQLAFAQEPPKTEPQPAPAPASEMPPPEPAPAPKMAPPRIFVAAGVALPFLIRADPGSPVKAMTFTPDERTSVAQALSVGYIINPKLAVAINALFLETLRTDTDGAKTGFAFGGIAAVVQYRFYKTLTFSAGPMFFYRSYFKYQNDLGAQYALAYGVPLPNKFGLAFVLSSPQAYKEHPVYALTAGVTLAKRF